MANFAVMILYSLIGIGIAERPTEGGLFSFDSEDVVDVYDLDAIRVHYSSTGPNVVRQTDDDGSGVPDFVEDVAIEANAVIDFYSELGFRTPLSESDMSLSPLGGSNAFDFYLVDFGGSADGMFGIDSCDGSQCSGYMVMENDFMNYGYPSISEAIRVLTSHELFHAVQGAYHAQQPSWLSEGSAVWGEWVYDPEALDFYWFAEAYLEDSQRSLHRPPAGLTTSFSYGTALFFAFMDEYYGEQRMQSIQEDIVNIGEEDPIEVVVNHMDSVSKDWISFSHWNLATGERAGMIESYTFAAEIDGITPEIEGELIQDNHRFYPLATTYYRYTHLGGSAQFVYQGDQQDVYFSIHKITDQGQVLEKSNEWLIGESPVFSIELDPGEYWLMGTLPILVDNSQKIEFCFGGACSLPIEDQQKRGCYSVQGMSWAWIMGGIVFYRRENI